MCEDVVSYEEMKNYENKDSIIIIDVRNPNEIQQTGKIGGSVNIPLTELEKALESLTSNEFQNKYGQPKPSDDFPLVFTCMKGGRAAKASALAKQLGFKNAKYYKGSWEEWEIKMKQNEKSVTS